MLKKSKKIAIALLILFLLITTVQVISETSQSKIVNPNDKDNFLYMFFAVQFGGALDNSLFNDLYELLVIPLLGSAVAIFVKNNNSFINYQQRAGYKGYLKRSCQKTFLTGAGISLLINCFQFVLVSLLYQPFAYQAHSQYLHSMSGLETMSDNSLIQLVLFVVLSAIGWGVFSLLIFAVGLLIKKNSIYIVSGGVIGLLSILSATIVAAKNGPLLILTDMIFLPNILSPGSLTLVNAHQPVGTLGLYLMTLATSLVAIYLLTTYWQKKKVQNG